MPDKIQRCFKGSQVYVFRCNRPSLPDRKGTLCKVLVRGKMNSCLVEFLSDGKRAVTSRNFVRKRKALAQQRGEQEKGS